YVYRAGAAGSDPATVLGTGHLQVITQNPEQRSTEVDGRLSCLTVHGELVSFHEQTSISGIPRARHAGFDPRPGGSDKFLMSERRQRAERAVTTAARLKCPEHQRFLHVMPQEAGTIEIPGLRAISQRRANFSARQDLVIRVLPLHRQRGKMPVIGAWDTGTFRIQPLMTRRTVKARHTFTVRPADHIKKVSMPVIALLRIVGSGVAVDATRMREYGVNTLPGG